MRLRQPGNEVRSVLVWELHVHVFGLYGNEINGWLVRLGMRLE